MEIDKAIKKAERLVSLLKEAKTIINQLSENNGMPTDELVEKVISGLQTSIDGNAQEVPYK